jgi:thiol-disulfide isomerase/thioredoxin
MPGRREALILAGVGVAAAGAGVFFGPLFLQSQTGAAQLLAVRYPDLTGKPRQLLEWKGKVVICNFWATWCEPCKEEMPLLARIHREYAPKSCEVVGIGIDRPDNIAKFATKYNIDYPLLVADTSALDIMRVLGNRAGALPYTVVLDRQGAIHSRKLGLLRAAELETVLAGALR